MFSGIAKNYFNDVEVEYFCDEAQLPGVNTATGTQNGVYLGVGSVDYPHTRVFTEFQLTFMLDANLSILKGLNKWYDSIFGEEERSDGTNVTPNRTNRLLYRNEYASDILVTKTESGPDSTTQRRPITYVMEKAYPYAIDAVPLQFGSSQITRVTAQFKYERHYTAVKDIKSIKGSVAGMNNEYIPNENGLGGYRPVVAGNGTELGVGANDLPSLNNFA